ncbi:GYD domain-containing protein [Candidatus Halobonum tyrrellensis]|uniref:Gyd domain n=1 Tax=Candidatus Halobonum tyrrellensis G22 TaxID=1324957 RepID=V4J092_9EURY|nr:GYD domain-containing protein [Candidatus Halobonum tyrrellensis]ESP88847.1 gyd domain [Candidatus Halobonum tyrrellensis G22]
MPTYVCEVDVEGETQNTQGLAARWGEIREGIERLGGELHDTYTVLGKYDFLVVFEVEDEHAAFQVSQVIEQHGLDTETMQAFPVERMGELVDDV